MKFLFRMVFSIIPPSISVFILWWSAFREHLKKVQRRVQKRDGRLTRALERRRSEHNADIDDLFFVSLHV